MAAVAPIPLAQTRALVIDDDPAVREQLRDLLERNGIEPMFADSAAAGLRTIFHERPDVVLLELALPGADAQAVLGRIRELTDAPVVVVSARAEEDATVAALRAGADDYVTKPFGPEELVARIEARLRRLLRPRPAHRERYYDGLVAVDYRSLEVRISGRQVELSALEMRLLLAFLEHPNQVLSADDLLDRVWGDRTLARERVKLYVGYLRAKFRAAGAEAPIETVRGFGYRYRPPAG